MERKPSIFRHTALTIAFGLLSFQLISAIAIFNYLIFPLAQRSADDMAALLAWSSQIWVTSPSEKRLKLEHDLHDRYGLTIKNADFPLTSSNSFLPYIKFLSNSLAKHLPENSEIRLQEKAHKYFQIQFLRSGKWIHFEFEKSLLLPKPALTLLWILLAGITATLVLAWILAKRVTAPIARLTVAVKNIGLGQKPDFLKEGREAEFAELIDIFNKTALQLQARKENQQTLLAGISHDLRSPLARMKMALGLLAQEMPTDLAARMERDINEMDQLIGSQLELSRAQELESAEMIDINVFLIDLVDSLSAQAPGRLELKRYPNIRLSVASLSLHRCLDNLILNAVRYSNGPVTIICLKYKQTLLFNIRDRGPGIPLPMQEKVFRPFYRLETSRNRMTGGSGLGLAITKQLTETHGWKVCIKSRYRGGASVWLSIPINE